MQFLLLCVRAFFSSFVLSFVNLRDFFSIVLPSYNSCHSKYVYIPCIEFKLFHSVSFHFISLFSAFFLSSFRFCCFGLYVCNVLGLILAFDYVLTSLALALALVFSPCHPLFFNLIFILSFIVYLSFSFSCADFQKWTGLKAIC